MSTAAAARSAQMHQSSVQQLKETHENMNQAMLDAIAMAQRCSTRKAPAGTSNT
jgi:hypothetical protein